MKMVTASSFPYWRISFVVGVVSVSGCIGHVQFDRDEWVEDGGRWSPRRRRVSVPRRSSKMGRSLGSNGNRIRRTPRSANEWTIDLIGDVTRYDKPRNDCICSFIETGTFAE